MMRSFVTSSRVIRVGLLYQVNYHWIVTAKVFELLYGFSIAKFPPFYDRIFEVSVFFQAAQQERSTFVSSLLPLLAEYSLQPPVADAQSIVSNVKVSML